MAQVSSEVRDRVGAQADAVGSAAGAAAGLQGFQTAAALSACQRRWKGALDKLESALDRSATTFDSNAGDYEAADVRQSWAFQQITAILKGD